MKTVGENSKLEHLILMIKNIESISNINAFKIAERFKDDDLVDPKLTRKKLILEYNQILKKRINDENYDSAKIIYQSIIHNCEKFGIKWLTYTNPLYPRLLFDLLKSGTDIPPIIYYKGDISPINQYRNIAVIGTREPEGYSVEEGEALAKALSDNEVNIISGLAIGCDTAGHKGALEGKRKYTVAVLANGLEKVYPAVNKGLADQIIQAGGCLMSEYPPKTKTMKWHFAQRDRLQSGLSEAIVVLETTTEGGTMITAGFAKKQKRKIFAYKNINKDKSQKFNGNDKLIADGAISLNYDIEVDVRTILNSSVELSQVKEEINEVKQTTKSIYNNWTIKSLKEELRKRGQGVSSKMKKEDLIKLLENFPKQESLF